MKAFISTADGKLKIIKQLPNDINEARRIALAYVTKGQKFILVNNNEEVEKLYWNGTCVTRELNPHDKLLKYITELGKTVFTVEKGEELCDALSDRGVCDDFYIRDGITCEGYIKEVRPNKNGFEVDVILNRGCGLECKNPTTFDDTHFYGSNVNSIMEFLERYSNQKRFEALRLIYG